MLDAVFIFLVTILADFGWARYTQAMAGRHKLVAGLWSAAVYFLGLVVVRDIVHKPSLILAACAGAFVGTVLGTEEEP